MLPDLPDWPHREASRAVDAAGLSWHVQVMGAGPVALLLHGAGSATHSYAALASRLADAFTLVIPDLPGHGFTSRASAARMSVRAIGTDVGALLQALALPPVEIAVGHSAGGAIVLHMAADGVLAPRAIIGIDAALRLPAAVDVPLLLPALRAATYGLSLTPLASWASDTLCDLILDSTRSKVDDAQRARYRWLARSRDRVGAMLDLIAAWDQRDLIEALARVDAPVTLVTGDRDRWIPSSVAVAAAARMRHAVVVPIRGAGHLALEDNPEAVSRIIRDAAS